MKYTKESAVSKLRRNGLKVGMENGVDTITILKVRGKGEQTHMDVGQGLWGAIDYLVGECKYVVRRAV